MTQWWSVVCTMGLCKGGAFTLVMRKNGGICRLNPNVYFSGHLLKWLTVTDTLPFEFQSTSLKRSQCMQTHAVLQHRHPRRTADVHICMYLWGKESIIDLNLITVVQYIKSIHSPRIKQKQQRELHHICIPFASFVKTMFPFSNVQCQWVVSQNVLTNAHFLAVNDFFVFLKVVNSCNSFFISAVKVKKWISLYLHYICISLKPQMFLFMPVKQPILIKK